MSKLKTYKLNYYGKNYTLVPVIQKYANNGTLCIQLFVNRTFEPFATLTVNLYNWNEYDREVFRENCAFVDTNNCDFARDFIRDNGLGEPVKMFDFECYGHSGFCQYPLYSFNLDMLNEQE